jgi:hypothetical protein
MGIWIILEILAAALNDPSLTVEDKVTLPLP